MHMFERFFGPKNENAEGLSLDRALEDEGALMPTRESEKKGGFKTKIGLYLALSGATLGAGGCSSQGMKDFFAKVDRQAQLEMQGTPEKNALSNSPIGRHMDAMNKQTRAELGMRKGKIGDVETITSEGGRVVAESDYRFDFNARARGGIKGVREAEVNFHDQHTEFHEGDNFDSLRHSHSKDKK